ncbi:hypothetical protein OH492_17585 [Vibrio chagasii]|nr:hypothetical protein [Vibrio chagasii]
MKYLNDVFAQSQESRNALLDLNAIQSAYTSKDICRIRSCERPTEPVAKLRGTSSSRSSKLKLSKQSQRLSTKRTLFISLKGRPTRSDCYGFNLEFVWQRQVTNNLGLVLKFLRVKMMRLALHWKSSFKVKMNLVYSLNKSNV